MNVPIPVCVEFFFELPELRRAHGSATKADRFASACCCLLVQIVQDSGSADLVSGRLVGVKQLSAAPD